MNKILLQRLGIGLLLILLNSYRAMSQQIEPGAEKDMDNPGQPMKSGLYQGVNLAEGKLPDESHVWMHMINARHANLTNNHQLQIASSYLINDRLFFRKIAAGDYSHNSDWIELATRRENTFTGTQFYPGKGIWNSNGKVGIGNSDPTHQLTVAGSATGDISVLKLQNSNPDYTAGYGSSMLFTSQAGREYAKIGGYTETSGVGWNGYLSFYTRSLIDNNHTEALVERMRLNSAGKVGIGTINLTGDYNLFVTKGIRTEKVQVDVSKANGWADYVFEPAYQLKSLSQVEQFIKANKHLPEVPSAEQVLKQGIDLGQMDATLLKKIEELTLYVIEQNKRLQALETKLKKYHNSPASSK